MNFDEAAAEWLRRNVTDANPVVGSVDFDIDWFSCASGPTYCNFDVTWTQQTQIVRKSSFKRLTLGGGSYDVTQLIRDIVEISLSDKTTNNPSE